jgi:uncharacterized membrane protein
MTDLPLHPAVVHLPIGLSLVMPIVAIALGIAVWRAKLPRSALALVAGLQLVLAGSAFAAMELGHREEKRAEEVAPREAIHEHEEAGEALVWSSVGVLALAIAALAVPARRAQIVAALTAAGTLVCAGLALDAGRKGGELVFHHGAGVQAVQTGGGPAHPAPDHDHDDD